MIVGIDFGASTIDVVLLRGKKIVKSFSTDSSKVKSLEKHLRSLNIDWEKIEKIAVTGGKSARMKKLLGKKVVRVNEINAIAAGGAFVSGCKNCLVVSMGTGTCIVSLRNGKARHLGGTGCSGGTVVGLSKLLLGTSDLKKIEALAEKGNALRVDLSVKDVVGCGIGCIPETATASNFAKLESRKKADLAAALLNLVAEVNVVAAVFAARTVGQRKIVLVGKAIELKGIVHNMRKAAKYWGIEFIIPSRAGVATAVGAALLAGKR